MIVVTGGTGHIGNVLIRELASRGEKVRALVLPNDFLKPLEGVNVEFFEGDILNLESLAEAFEGAETVYHLAAIISIESGKEDLLRRINVDGTKNVIRACIKCGVKRLVYTSSIHAIKEPPAGTTIDESCPFEQGESIGAYDKTKAEATLEVLKAVKEKGLDAVVVCPTGVIGPYDFRISQMAQVFIDFIRGKLKVYIDGAYDFVDVRDLAKGMILVAEKGRKGESYILSGERITVAQMLQILEEAAGVKKTLLKSPRWLVVIAYPLISLYYKILHKPPIFTPYSMRTLCSNSDISHEKASLELGYSPGNIKKAIADTINWLKENKLVD